MARDDFTLKTKVELAKRVSYMCSNPYCSTATVGPKKGDEGTISIGEAAHITGAAEGGFRYNPSLTSDQRKHINNGIWLCASCAKLIDSDIGRFSVDVLNEWKVGAELRAHDAVVSRAKSTRGLNQIRKAKIARWRDAIGREQYQFGDSRSQFLASKEYSELKLYLLPETILMVEDFRSYHVPGPRGDPLKVRILDEISQLESVWNLV